MEPIIIVIEGTDGCGKGTQTKKLVESLETMGLGVYTKSFPNYDSPSSEPVKMYLGGAFGDTADCLNAYQASTLFASDRLATYKLEIEPAIKQGNIIVLDRYTTANMVHQCSKIDEPIDKMKYISWAENFEYGALKLPRPTITFFLDMPAEKSIELAHARGELKAGTSKDIHEADEEYLKKSYKNGKWVANKLDWKIINCVNKKGEIKTIDEIHNEIMQEVMNTLDYYNELEQNQKQ